MYINREQSTNNSSNLIFIEPSTTRRVKDLFFKIILSCWRTAANYFCTVSLSDEFKQRISQVDPEKNLVLAALTELKNKGDLAPASIETLFDNFLSRIKKPDRSEQKIGFVSSFLHKAASPIIPNEVKNKDIVLIPVVVEGLFGAHIVAVLYDKKANRIEFYDSNGLSCQDHSGYVRCNEKQTLRDVLTLICQAFANEKTTVWENTSKHQYDCHNCGVYVLNYFESRIYGCQPDVISQKGLSFEEANDSYRRFYIDRLLQEQNFVSKDAQPEPEVVMEALDKFEGED